MTFSPLIRDKAIFGGKIFSSIVWAHVQSCITWPLSLFSMRTELFFVSDFRVCHTRCWFGVHKKKAAYFKSPGNFHFLEWYRANNWVLSLGFEIFGQIQEEWFPSQVCTSAFEARSTLPSCKTKKKYVRQENQWVCDAVNGGWGVVYGHLSAWSCLSTSKQSQNPTVRTLSQTHQSNISVMAVKSA